MDGKLESCLGSDCWQSCCEKGYSEPLEEYIGSFREKNISLLEKLGISITIKDRSVFYNGCSDGKNCKMLDNFDDDVRSLTCRIYPYLHQEITIGKETYIGIQLMPCPATGKENLVPKEFTDEVIKLIKKEYVALQGKDINVEIVNPIQRF